VSASGAGNGTLGGQPNYGSMPRYFFRLEGDERIADKRGYDLPNDSAARREAEGIAAALRRSRGDVWSVIVTNEWGNGVTEIPGPLRPK
jgi:hypothetical protein